MSYIQSKKSTVDLMESAYRFDMHEYSYVIIGLALAEEDVSLSQFLFEMSMASSKLELCPCLVEA